MDFYGKGSLHSLMVEENMEHQPQIHLSVRTHKEISKHDVQLTSPRPSTSESPWKRFPRLISPPPPSLLYYFIASLHRHDVNIYAIAASKGLVFTGSDSNRIRVWKQPDCMDRGYLKANSGEVRPILAYSDLLFSTHKDHRIRIWNFMVFDPFKSKKVATLLRKSLFLLFSGASSVQQHKDSVSCMAYYHSEGALYPGSHDRIVKAWRVSDRKCVDSFVAHEDNVNSLMVNQDDGCLFSCFSDRSVKIWRRGVHRRLAYPHNDS